jgi:hypothetical protein
MTDNVVFMPDIHEQEYYSGLHNPRMKNLPGDYIFTLVFNICGSSGWTFLCRKSSA